MKRNQATEARGDILYMDNHLVAALCAPKSTDDALNLVLETAMRVVGMECGGIYLANMDSGCYRMVKYAGLSRAFARTVLEYKPGSRGVHVIQSGKPVYIRREGVLSIPSCAPAIKESLKTVCICPVQREDRVCACINVASRRDMAITNNMKSLLESVAAQSGAYLETLSWRMSALNTREQLRGLTRKLVASREEERARIARDLHDQMGKHLTAMALGIENALHEKEIDRRLLENLHSGILDAAADLRSICRGLRLHWEDGLKFNTAVEALGKEWRRISGMELLLDMDDIGLEEIGREEAISAYRIVQEALTNVIKHSGATRAKVKINKTNGHLGIVIEDNGRGIKSSAAKRARGLGMTGMKERTGLCGGRMRVKSKPGEGVRIEVRIPLKANAG